jgi:hypothetical protein
MLESKSNAMASHLQPRCTIDEKGHVVDEMFLAEFGKEHLGQHLCSRRIGPHMEQAVGVGADPGGRPISLIIGLNHGVIDRNVSGWHYLWAVNRPSVPSCEQWIDSKRHTNQPLRRRYPTVTTPVTCR